MKNEIRKLPGWFALLALPLAAPASAQYQLVDAFPSITFVTPLDIAHAGDSRLFVVEKDGRIHVIDSGTKHLFLDISLQVTSIGEAGLLAMTFPPEGASAGHFYVFYVTDNPTRSIVSRFAVSVADSNAADPVSEEIVLSVDQPAFFHNGGTLAFGPRPGELHVSIGEWTDPARAQDLTCLGGSILRIDVRSSDPGLNYFIPRDNPFYGNSSGYREEILAFGFRNPWRMSFDPVRGTLWVGDVGLDTREEVDRVFAGRNYGWPQMEGTVCPAPCDTSGDDLVLPVHEYDHTLGNAVIGGHVYRGSDLWQLIGHYVFTDYTGGRFWSFDVDASEPGPMTEILSGAPVLLTLGTDAAGEIYAGGGDGLIYRLESTVTAVGPDRAPAFASLGAPYPNPFTLSSAIPFTLSSGAHVSVTVHDVRGHHIRTLETGRWGAGAHTTRWDGDDSRGNDASSGVYFVSLHANGALVGRTRMVLVR